MCFAVWLILPRVCVPAFVNEILVSFMLGREASDTNSLSPSAVSVWPATLWSITTSSPTSSSSSSSSAAAHWLPRIQSEPTPSGTMWVYNVRSEVTHRGLSTFGDTLYLFIQITQNFSFSFNSHPTCGAYTPTTSPVWFSASNSWSCLTPSSPPQHCPVYTVVEQFESTSDASG